MIAATEFELAWVAEAAPTLACGIGPVEAAVATAHRLAQEPPDAVLHVGIAGARRAAGLAVGAVVVGTSARYEDLAAAIPVTDVAWPAPALLAAARRALPDAPALEIATTAAVGRSGAEAAVEAMEGFGVLRAAALRGVPALELRAISNLVEEEDRARWDMPGALAALGDAAARVLRTLRDQA